jgi:hypothetical protein
MCSGCLVCIGNSILRFRGQKHEFCRSGTDELRLSKTNLAQAKSMSNQTANLAWHLAWSLLTRDSTAQHFFLKFHVVLSTKLFLAVSYNIKNPSKSSTHCTLRLKILVLKCMNNINNFNDEKHMRCYDTILDTGSDELRKGMNVEPQHSLSRTRMLSMSPMYDKT